MKNEPSEKLVQAIAVTAELSGTQLSPTAARVFADNLAHYPEAQVLAALDNCRRELRGRLTLAEVILRLDDGRPGPDEAWAMVMHALADERITIVWTEEMAVASGPARAIIDDPVAARMAFLASYRRLVQAARDKAQPVIWTPCLGWDLAGRDGPLLEAASLGRLTPTHVQALLPHHEDVAPEIARLTEDVSKRLKGPGEEA